MEGYIHSLESCGTVDGPGLRFVVFLQGCPLRCKYCHNPDTWKPNVGNKMSVSDILKKYNKKSSFYKNGGITVTGGEPLMQMEFVTELFKACKNEGIHTCLDTSGVTFTPGKTEKFDLLMMYTDLVMLDIKHIDNVEHKELTGLDNGNILSFAKYLDKKNISVWIRHVVVPTITQNDKYLKQLGNFIGTLHNIKALDVLPYHVMGRSKYQEMGLTYPLEGIEPLDKEDAIKARTIILEGMREVRK
ncbi:pyruvate formate-lyase-activating protein [Tannockella kyphosi]|uniref:pyruvate formate-lyase-activating protein n=1 Tax=Tannockella kyphosi TaxID=2899121 RepID=UPI002012FF87|nr:pyruvate formate-lyase-activating protein [Tannockella kyphosi]